MPRTEYALPVYYLLAPSEASSNLAHYDGVRYGYRTPGDVDLIEMFQKTRDEGFGPEVKRRVMLGTYALSAGYYDAYYRKAQQVRTLIARDFERAWERVDVILTPSVPSVAFELGAKADPLEMYLNDIYTIPANLAGSGITYSETSAYDGAGRLSLRTGGEDRDISYDGETTLTERKKNSNYLDGNGNPLYVTKEEWMRGGSGDLAVSYPDTSATPTVNYTLYDPFGGVAATIEGSGTAVSHSTSEMYGTEPQNQTTGSGIMPLSASIPTPSTGSGAEKNWQGANGYRYRGTPGVYQVGYRVYDPRQGRFLQQDPLTFGQGDYTYAFNSPANYNDPTGLSPEEDLKTAVCVGAYAAIGGYFGQIIGGIAYTLTMSTGIWGHIFTGVIAGVTAAYFLARYGATAYQAIAGSVTAQYSGMALNAMFREAMQNALDRGTHLGPSLHNIYTGIFGAIGAIIGTFEGYQRCILSKQR